MGDRSLLTTFTSRALSFSAIVLLTAAGAMAQGQQAPPAPQDQTPHPWRTAADDAAPGPDQTQAAQPQANPAAQPPGYSNYPSFPAAPQANQLPNPGTPLPGNGNAGYQGNGQAPPPYAGQQQGPYQGQQGPYQGQQGPYQGQQGPYQGQQGPYQGQPNPYAGQMAPSAPPRPIPAHLTIKPGTFITIRTTQPLSSDHNQVGDNFIATLADPIVVDGVVVAQRGETVSGRVTEAQKAGRVEGTSKLGVELTSITLVDGDQLPVQSQMLSHNGSTSIGRDAAAIGGTTALGAAVGAGADWGRGAAIGAGAGAAVGIIGVLLTRGHPTVIAPESTLTFRLNAPVEVATDHAPQAFHFVSNRDYGTGGYARPPASGYAGGPGPVGPSPYNYGPAYYPYPYYWGPGVSVFVGRGFYGRGYWR